MVDNRFAGGAELGGVNGVRAQDREERAMLGAGGEQLVKQHRCPLEGVAIGRGGAWLSLSYSSPVDTRPVEAGKSVTVPPRTLLVFRTPRATVGDSFP